jgi:hypothetical protein
MSWILFPFRRVLRKREEKMRELGELMLPAGAGKREREFKWVL